jgi:EmrB/QacA subfamily drug resistance transporter
MPLVVRHRRRSIARRALTSEVIDAPRARWDRPGMATITVPTAPVLAPRRGVLPVVLAGTFMVVLDFFIVNVALPSMQARLHAGAGAIEWVVAGYALTSAVFLVAGGRLGDQLGRRRMFSLGLGLFTLASAACGLAPDAETLVVARLAQGAAASLLMPNVLSIIGVVYTGAERVRALSAYGATMGVAALSGQLLGGVLVEADPAGLGWRTCFLVNLPVGLVALALAPRLVPESKASRTSGLDLTGTALVTAAVTAIVLPLIEGREHGWPAWTWISLAFAPVLVATLVAHQRRLAQRGGAPVLDPGVFRHRSFRAGLVTQTAFWAGQASFFLVLALYLQQGRGLSALHAGVVFTVCAVAYVAASAPAPALTVRHGRRLLAGGALVLAAGHAALLVAVLETHAVAALVPGLLLVGAGMGFVLTPLTTTLMSTMEPELAGAASGALATMQNVGNALGVAITGVIFFGALHAGAAHAFALSLVELAALLVGVAALTRLLPAPVRSAS